VEGGFVKTGRVRLGPRVLVGLGAVVGIGVEAGEGCQIGALCVVPKHTVLDAHGSYIGAPARKLPQPDEHGERLPRGAARS
jgi:acetyltransferase-like isoleucine patch superfamily enzyme